MPILNPNTLEFISRHPDQTRRLGARLGALIEGGTIIALEGTLGAGKTVLAQGIGRGWGATSRLISPTFVLVRRHERPQDDDYLYHIDLYRLSLETEAVDLGLSDVLGALDTVCIIEWADRAPGLLPDDYLWVTLAWVDEFRRTLTFRASGASCQALLETFRKEIIGR